MGTFTEPLLHTKHLHWIKLNQYKPAGKWSMGTAFPGKQEIILKELPTSLVPCSPCIHCEGQKAAALVVITLAMHDASTAHVCSYTPARAQPLHHSWQGALGLRQSPLQMAVDQLEPGAVLEGWCLSLPAQSTWWTTASLPNACFVCRWAFTNLGSLLQLLSHS